MTLDEFISKYEGQEVGYPNDQYKGECLSLVKRYIEECFNIYPPPSGCGAARCYWTNFPDPLGVVFKKAENTPDLIPKKGWICVWDEGVGSGYGHIDIVISGDVARFEGFDQNWGGRHAHRVTHNYNNVYGFLVPKEDNMLLEYLGVQNEQEAKAKLKEHLGEKDNKCDWGSEEGNRGGFLGSARRTVKNQEQTIKDLQEEIDNPITPNPDKTFGEETGAKAHFDENGDLEWFEKTYKPIQT